MTLHSPPRPRRRRLVPLGRAVALAGLTALLLPGALSAQTNAAGLYSAASDNERTVRSHLDTATPEDFRAAIKAYELVVRKYPRSGYCDNALWQASGLALEAYERFHQPVDRRAGESLLKWLRLQYPASPLAARADAQIKRFAAAEPVAPATVPADAAPKSAAAASPPVAPPKPRAATAGPPTIRQLTRQPLPTGVRVVIELDTDVEYVQDQLSNPARVFIDLKQARLGTGVNRHDLAVADDVIRVIRVGPRPDGSRVVVELVNEARYTLIALYDPFRLVLDFERPRPVAAPAPPSPAPTAPAPAGPPVPAPAPAAPATQTAPKVAAPAPPEAPPDPAPAATRPAEPAKPPVNDAGAQPEAPLASSPTPALLAAPVAPARNLDGAFSLARQLGLSVSRVVIDPGHGGHDPGAQAFGLDEAAIVLDVALKLESLLKAAGVDVVMTRRSDVFIPLEERTALANRENADLFLSIHANASPNKRATGIETYYLNFASNPDAERVAARENSASGRAMHNLSDIVQAIALNNKLEESRDLARFVQDSIVKRAKTQNKGVRNLGVKQAPFVVLIGAQMPSVLAEVSFITNKGEASLLKKITYRERLAQALFDAVMRYQKSLKANVAVAQRSSPDARD